MKELQPSERIDALISRSSMLLLQFGTASCAPCIAIRSKLDQWLAGHPQVEARYVPLEQFTQLAAQQNVFSAPATLLYVGGKELLRGRRYYSLEELLHRAERYLSFLEDV